MHFISNRRFKLGHYVLVKYGSDHLPALIKEVLQKHNCAN